MTEDSRQVLNKIKKEMKNHFLEMDEIIEGLFTALLAEQNILLIGPPGSAKTQISKFIAKAINGEFFDQLMTKHTVPEELFGPIDIIAMREEKKFKRASQGTLATADIALLDEIWKSSSAIVNYLLRALNEREFKENGKTIPLPLKMAIGCSNEYPQGEETSAIYDRFNLKYETTYIEEDKNFISLLNSKDIDPVPSDSISIKDLQKMIEESKSLLCPDPIIETMTEMRRELKNQGIILSPRRWKKAIRLLKAHAYLRGAKEIEEDDLSFLGNILWNDPQQKQIIIKLIHKTINPIIQKALEILDMANEVMTEINKKTGSQKGAALIEGRSKFVAMRKDLNIIKKQIEDQGKQTSKIDEIYNKVSEYQRNVAEELLNGV
jgi:MoxR-like ATPase